ncbi:hypothetical protein GCM10027047_12730 [Rhodococcus aerolatus]
MTRRTVLLTGAALVALLVAAVLVVLHPPATTPAVTLPAGVVTDRFDLPGGAAAVRAQPGPGTPRPLALWVHGSGADEDDPVTGFGAGFTAALLADGWVVASAVADGNAWGDAASQDDYRALVRAAAQRYPLGPVVVVSVSMGGVAGLDLASDGTVPGVVGWLGVSAVTDLAQARTRFRGVDAVMTPAEVAAADPSQRPVTDYAGLAVVLRSATDDDRVPTATQAAPFAARVPGADLRPCTGGHVSADCFHPDDVLAMLR